MPRYDAGGVFTDRNLSRLYTRQTTISEKIDEGKKQQGGMDHSKRTDPLHGACQGLTLHPGGSSEIHLTRRSVREFDMGIKGTVKLCYGGKGAHRKRPVSPFILKPAEAFY